jgi:hypothetical protein
MEAYDEEVEKDLIDRPRELRCAWHKKFFGEELVMREGPTPASHGICEECKKRFLAEKSVA